MNRETIELLKRPAILECLLNSGSARVELLMALKPSEYYELLDTIIARKRERAAYEFNHGNIGLGNKYIATVKKFTRIRNGYRG